MANSSKPQMMMQTRYDKYQRMDVDEILPGLYLCKYTSIFKGEKNVIFLIFLNSDCQICGELM